MQEALSRMWITAVTLVTALAFTMSAQFQAPSPGALLEPIGDAAQQIRLTQGQHSLLWTSLGATVEGYRVQGWPSSDGVNELGGAVQIEKVIGEAGVINFGERPMVLEFNLRD